MPPERRAQLGVARTFQVTNLFPGLTVRENVALAILATSHERRVLWRPLTSRSAGFQQAERVLGDWGMLGWGSMRAGSLPYGQQRRLDIVLAMACTPRVLLLDEPTAGLSSADKEAVGATILALPRDVSLLIIEHDMELAFRLADRVTVMHNGSVLVEGSVDEVRKDGRVREIYLGVEKAAV
jgi:ABC-type branched-subunit amino acid transport system ATPase component